MPAHVANCPTAEGLSIERIPHLFNLTVSLIYLLRIAVHITYDVRLEAHPQEFSPLFVATSSSLFAFGPRGSTRGQLLRR
jgi:hypothetical protein